MQKILCSLFLWLGLSTAMADNAPHGQENGETAPSGLRKIDDGTDVADVTYALEDNQKETENLTDLLKQQRLLAEEGGDWYYAEGEYPVTEKPYPLRSPG